jgi:hypothetical protein
MKNLIVTISLAILLTALPTFSQEGKLPARKADSGARQTTDKKKKQDLYSRWEKLKKDKPAEARQVANEYFVSFPDDKSKKAQVLKKWVEDNEKTLDIEAIAKMGDKTVSLSNETVNKSGETATGDTNNVAGTWMIVVTTKQGDLQFTLNLKQDGENLSGSVQSPYGDGTVKSGKINGNVIYLDMEAEPLEVKLNGTLDDKKMKGTVTSNIPNIPALPFVGTRSK